MGAMNTATIERFSQPAEVQAVIERTRYTIACQNVIAPEWVWSELSTTAWEAQLNGVTHPQTGLRQRLVESDSERDQKEAELNELLKHLHDATVTSLGIARIRWRGQPARRLVFAQLSALGRNPGENLAEAELWELAWEEIDPGFVAAEGLALADFAARRAAAVAAIRPVRRACIRRASVAGQLAVALLALDDVAQAWYAEATSVFRDSDQGAGEVIRRLPTTYVPRYAEAARRRRAAAAAPAAPTPAP